MAELAITKIRQSPFVTVSMIAMCVAGIVSWIILMAGAAAVESDKNKKIDVDDADDFFGASFSAYSGVALAVDLGFSWWLMVYTGLLYVFATLVWLLSMAKGVSVFVAASQPLALLFTVAFAWTGVEMRNARALTGYSSSVDAWFTGLFLTACTTGVYMLFFASWQALAALKVGAPVDSSVQQKQHDIEAQAPATYVDPPVMHYNIAAAPAAVGAAAPGGGEQFASPAASEHIVH